MRNLRNSIIFFAFFSVSPLLLIAQLPAGSIANYPLDNSANDVSGNGYDGTLTSTTNAANRFSTANSAASFSAGASSGTFPGTLATALSNDISIGYWFNTTMTAPSSPQWYGGAALIDAEVCGQTDVTKRLPVITERTAVSNQQCAVIATLKLFATKWKPCIICYLMERPRRYNELYRIIPNISRKMLSGHLAELVTDSLIVRTQYDPKMQRVEYRLSEKGETLLPLLLQIQDCGMQHLEGVLSVREMIGQSDAVC